MRKFHSIIEEIKKLSDEQREIKPQRKTVNLSVERKIEPHIAAAKAVYNSEKLMNLFIAYAIIRGKEPQIPTKQVYNKKSVDSFIEHYNPKEII